MDEVVPLLTRRLTATPLVRRTPSGRVQITAALEWSDGSSEVCRGWALQWAWFGAGVLPQVQCQLPSARLGRSVLTWCSAATVHLQ